MARLKKEIQNDEFNNSGLLNRLKKASKTDTAEIMSEYDDIAPRDFINTGNYLLNALISADPFKGMPSGKIMTLASPPGCGKSYIALEILKNAQKMGYSAILYDSEMANSNHETLKARGIDVDNLLYIPIGTIEELKTSMLNILDEIGDTEKVIVVIDSLSNLSSIKEMEDSKTGSDKKDMTKAAVLKSFFRTVTLKAGLKQVPIISISHVYSSIGSFIPVSIISGGQGGLYMSSIVIQMTKAQDKEGNETVGAIVTAKTDKCRFSKEKQKIKFKIDFNHGISRYSGLLGFCEDEKVMTKEGRSFIYKEQKYSLKDLNKEFWDTELKGDLGKYIIDKFRYQSVSEDLNLSDDVDN